MKILMSSHRRYDKRNKKTNKFYQSREWRNKRLEILERDNHCCQCADCIGKGILTLANTVDHIEPIELGGALLDDDNLQAMSEQCHARKSAKERWKR
jgi:5-methylcytosine-specific restriction enzyme A